MLGEGGVCTFNFMFTAGCNLCGSCKKCKVGGDPHLKILFVSRLIRLVFGRSRPQADAYEPRGKFPHHCEHTEGEHALGRREESYRTEPYATSQ